MLIDGRGTEGLPETSYDIVVIGAGPAGITLAHELRGTGLRIALLESGGEEYDDAAQALNAGVIEGNDSYDLEFSRLRYLGGTSNHWGGHCTPLDPIDFARAPDGATGWPFSREALLPYYERAHPYCDLGRFEYGLDALAPDDPDTRILADAEGIETAILRQSAPTRFGEKYRAALAEAENIDVWLWTTATGVSTTPGETEWVDTRTLDGIARRFTARAVVLAGGTIEATRLALWSNDRNGTRVGDAGGLLGRCFMDHPSGGASFLNFDTQVGTKIYWSGIDTYADGGTPLHFVLRLSDERLQEAGLPNGHFFVIPYSEDEGQRALKRRADASVNGMKTVAKWILGRDMRGKDVGDAWCNGVTGLDDLVRYRAAVMTGRIGVRRVLLKYEIEQLPDRENGIRLDPGTADATGLPQPILTWKPTGTEDIVKETVRYIAEAAGATGLGRMELEDHEGPYWNTTTAWHQLGTMRMAESETAGVTDPTGRVHGAGQLYVAGGATFPTVGRANPTLTLVALTVRLADHLKGALT